MNDGIPLKIVLDPLAGTCLVPADAKCEPVVATDQAQLEMIGNALQNSNFNLGTGGQNPAQNPMIITIQYKGRESLEFI